MSGPGITALIFSKEEMNDTTKIVQLLDLLITDVRETIINEAKKTKRQISQYVIRNIRC